MNRIRIDKLKADLRHLRLKNMATSLGVEACKAGFRVQFFKFQELLSSLYFLRGVMVADPLSEVLF